MKEEVNPHLLRMQYRSDDVEQQTRWENVRISGLPESEGEETEDQLISKVQSVAEKAGVKISDTEISSCHRLGMKSDAGRARQTIVRFALRRKRDLLYSSRFKLKGKDGCRNVFINEDLTTMICSVLMCAKESPQVKGDSSRNGSSVKWRMGR